MAQLAIYLLGPFQATLAGEPVVGFESDKARGLLAYLVVEADRPHRRQVLAGLLWPDWSERAARSNLRRTLANLRRVIGDHDASPPFLAITRQTLQFNQAGDYWLDVAACTASLAAETPDQAASVPLAEGVALYRGPFLEGFSITDSPTFEEWALFKREQLARQVLQALQRLTHCYERAEAYEAALSYAWRQIELEPWHEIGQLVEGMPLGIELAAAWLKLFPPAKIAREIEDSLDFLATAQRNVPARHRSMRALFEHSWGLLSAAERKALRRLSLFRGGFCQVGAAQVTGASFSVLVALVEKSLLHLISEDRYHLHELLRQFAAEKLQAVPEEEEKTQADHSRYYLAFVGGREAALKGGGQRVALAEIAQERENIRAAW